MYFTSSFDPPQPIVKTIIAKETKTIFCTLIIFPPNPSIKIIIITQKLDVAETIANENLMLSKNDDLAEQKFFYLSQSNF
jgi:hypothetical protein